MSENKARNFDDFQLLARKYRSHIPEVLDFPPNLRQGYEPKILADFDLKVPRIADHNSRILDIGSGCGELTLKLIDQSANRKQELHLVDGREVLDLLPNPSHVVKHYGKFQNLEELSEGYIGYFDVIICYSVFQYIFPEFPFFEFLQRTSSLLNAGGMLLIGDIPNESMKSRMLNSNYGKEFRKYYVTPTLGSNNDYSNFEIDDSVIYAMIMRGRAMGLQSYILPQSSDLAFSNRREDLLFVKF